MATQINMPREMRKHVASMISEFNRLGSFFFLINQSGFNYNIRYGPIRLAKQGIFYHEEYNILICYFCEKETDVDELRSNSIIIILHKSTCSFKDGSRDNSTTNNIPIHHPDDEQCQLINNELHERYCVNDNNWFMSISQENSDQTSRDGLFDTILPIPFNNFNNNPFDLVSTNVTDLTSNMRIDIPESQPFLNNLSTQSNSVPPLPLGLPVPCNQTVGQPNIPFYVPSRDSNSPHHRDPQESTDSGLKSDGGVPDRPYSKFTNNGEVLYNQMMANYQNRLNTFKNWPHHSISSRDMSKAGLYMTGRGDSVKCFTCGVILKDWDPTDDPFTEHQKWSTGCSYIAENYSKSKSENNEKKTKLETLYPSATGTNTMPLSVLTSTEAESLREENEKLKNETTCRICLDNPAEILTLPCAHISCCATCAAPLKKCPICRRVIQGTVKIFLS
ncbi:E3 ubiquitin-protein ligase XIAP [Patella vulgata]|uniref:E3 ubiquitin-protein ligase XIAP n=1 Tax=Patella vulgata TaxID=6465 RepID=UPI0024A7D784|nr:E3 ubiquitin-protein ligase XIAP [Patella vulgata]XP_050394515.2 E3 ubiquitin-protein ligase XIAP [Patella vulgata]